MEILEGDALYRLLLQRYSRNPRGWSITISPSQRNGFFDALVGGPEESWHLKLDTIFKPSPFVLGAKTDQDPPRTPAAPLSFGFRRVNPQEAPAILDDDSPEGMNRLLAFLSSVSPVAPTGPGSYVQGPYLYTNRGQAAASMTREQVSVDSRLSDEMVKLVRRRYPSYL
jgi:hypothetical protein